MLLAAAAVEVVVVVVVVVVVTVRVMARVMVTARARVIVRCARSTETSPDHGRSCCAYNSIQVSKLISGSPLRLRSRQATAYRF